MDIRTAITHHGLSESFSKFNESDEHNANNILLSREQAKIPVNCMRRRLRKRRQTAGCLLRIHRQSNKPPLSSILLAKVQSLEKKIDDARLNYRWDIQNCNILCFTESWLNDDTNNIQQAGYTLYQQDRTTASGKTRGAGLSIFVNKCTISKEVSNYCSPEEEYLIISCRPHYLPIESFHLYFS